MDIGDILNVMFPPGATIRILQGNNPERNLLSCAEHYNVLSYSSRGIVVEAITGTAAGLKFFIPESTPIIIMEVK